MARYPYAAKTLIKQLEGKYKNPDVTPADEPDGLGVHRTFRVGNQHAVAFIKKAMLAFDRDDRVESVTEDGKALLITFVASGRADVLAEFPLDDAVELASDD